MFVYIKSEPGLWTVGFYTPAGVWEAESDHTSTEDAARRVRFLNGGKVESVNADLLAALRVIAQGDYDNANDNKAAARIAQAAIAAAEADPV